MEHKDQSKIISTHNPLIIPDKKEVSMEHIEKNIGHFQEKKGGRPKKEEQAKQDTETMDAVQE